MEKRQAKKDGTFPVKLRVTYQRKRKYYALGKMSFSESDFEKIETGNCRGSLKEVHLQLKALETRAREVIKEMADFSFEQFEETFFTQTQTTEKKGSTDIFVYFAEKIAVLEQEDRVKTASGYACSMASLKEFIGKKNQLDFEEITPEFLKAYEKFMQNKGNSLTTIGFYLRNVRALFNDAIANHLIQIEKYPFGKRKYPIPTGSKVKKSLSAEELKKLYQYPAEAGSNEAFSKDLWFFSLYCNGMNLKDIALLKYENLSEDKITFVRAKTARSTRSNPIEIQVMILPQVRAILDRWGQKPQEKDTYIFPILEKGITAKEQAKKIAQCIKTTNKYIKRIAEKLNITHLPTTYSARHSFATMMLQLGASVEHISESLGHTNISTTQHYLAGFDDSTKRKFAEKLMGLIGEE